MPVSLTEMLRRTDFYPVTELLAQLRREDDLEPLGKSLGFGPAQYYRLRRRGVTVGLIGALSDLHFCDHCNKMRLTCDGKLRPCLGNHLETDLKPALRPVTEASRLRELLRQHAGAKAQRTPLPEQLSTPRVMTAIGG